MNRPIAAGNRVRLADGRHAIVSDASVLDKGVLTVLPVRPDWPFPSPPEVALVEACTRLPSRYHGEVAQPPSGLPDALV
jgi:hypothetical protein